jgi:hypothetical protein
MWHWLVACETFQWRPSAFDAFPDEKTEKVSRSFWKMSGICHWLLKTVIFVLLTSLDIYVVRNHFPKLFWA